MHSYGLMILCAEVVLLLAILLRIILKALPH